MDNGYSIIRKTHLLCPNCGHFLVIANIDNVETLYCQRCKEDIYEEDIYEDRREQTYRNNNRRESLEYLL